MFGKYFMKTRKNNVLIKRVNNSSIVRLARAFLMVAMATRAKLVEQT